MGVEGLQEEEKEVKAVQGDWETIPRLRWCSRCNPFPRRRNCPPTCNLSAPRSQRYSTYRRCRLRCCCIGKCSSKGL